MKQVQSKEREKGGQLQVQETNSTTPPPPAVTYLTATNASSKRDTSYKETIHTKENIRSAKKGGSPVRLKVGLTNRLINDHSKSIKNTQGVTKITGDRKRVQSVSTGRLRHTYTVQVCGRQEIFSDSPVLRFTSRVVSRQGRRRFSYQVHLQHLTEECISSTTH